MSFIGYGKLHFTESNGCWACNRAFGWGHLGASTKYDQVGGMYNRYIPVVKFGITVAANAKRNTCQDAEK